MGTQLTCIRLLGNSLAPVPITRESITTMSIFPADADSLPPEELAGFVLERLLVAKADPNAQLSLYNFCLHFDARDKHLAAEAWTWLVQAALLVFSPEQPDGWYKLSRKAESFLSRLDLANYRLSKLLPRENLDPELVAKAWPLYARGSYDTAIREALLILEVRIRAKAKLTAADYGQDLIAKAFRPDVGILTDTTLEKAEQVGLLNIMQGVFGHLRNPVSHRHAGTQPVPCAEIIQFVNYLLRIVDSRP
jgi:uncharacterized protein (TIGR02391 family)